MRLVIYGGACSLDGFIARAGGEVDWLHFSPDVAAIMKDYWPRFDTMLMGRKTWDVMANRAGGGKRKATARRQTKKKAPAGMGGIRTYVFSRTLTEDPAPGVTLVREDPGAFVDRLKTGPGKDICVMGGGELAASLFAAGVVDEVGFNIHPVLLGGGIPAFVNSGRETALELTDCRRIDGGCVYVSYKTRR